MLAVIKFRSMKKFQGPADVIADPLRETETERKSGIGPYVKGIPHGLEKNACLFSTYFTKNSNIFRSGLCSEQLDGYAQ